MSGLVEGTSVVCRGCGEPIEWIHTRHGPFPCEPGLVLTLGVRKGDLIFLEDGEMTMRDRMTPRGLCRLPHHCPADDCLEEKP